MIVVAIAAGSLGALAFKGCGKIKTVTWCPPIDMDSLKATLPPDTILIPGPGKQVVKWQTKYVNLKDTAAVDSLRRAAKEQMEYYAGLFTRLDDAVKSRDTALTNAKARVEELELLLRTNEYSDSVKTDTYEHHWRIVADGPIRSYTYGIVPIFPPQTTIPKAKYNRVAVFAGGQAEAGAIRPIYELEYSRKWLGCKAGYLPKSKTLGTEPAFQFSTGVNIRF